MRTARPVVSITKPEARLIRPFGVEVGPIVSVLLRFGYHEANVRLRPAWTQVLTALLMGSLILLAIAEGPHHLHHRHSHSQVGSEKDCAVCAAAVALHSAETTSVRIELPMPQTIDALTIKASQAQPRDQCFLYAELVHQMTELSLRQYAAGDVEKASGLLKQIQLPRRKIHISVSEDDKRLKNTEILLRRTAFRLSQLLH